jgi:hypothetical protein
MKIDASSFRVSNHQWVKRPFNPTNAVDLGVYREFLAESRWANGCPFVLEWPFLNIVDMIKHKIVYQHIDSLIDQAK